MTERVCFSARFRARSARNPTPLRSRYGSSVRRDEDPFASPHPARFYRDFLQEHDRPYMAAVIATVGDLVLLRRVTAVLSVEYAGTYWPLGALGRDEEGRVETAARTLFEETGVALGVRDFRMLGWQAGEHRNVYWYNVRLQEAPPFTPSAGCDEQILVTMAELPSAIHTSVLEAIGRIPNFA